MRSRRERLLTRELLLTCLVGSFQILAFGSTLPLLSRFVEGELGGGGVAVGVTLGSFSVSAIALRPWLGRIGDTHGRRVLIVIGGLLVATALTLIIVPVVYQSIESLRQALRSESTETEVAT